MSTPPPASVGTTAPALRGRELLAVAGLVAVWLAVMVTSTGAASALGRLPWVDELFTLRVVALAGTRERLAALAAGVDMAPPATYELLAGWTRLLGDPGIAGQRAFPLACVGLAVVGAHAALRRAVGPLAALAGALSLAGHPLVLRHAFELRFYAPWLAALSWTAVLVGAGGAGRRRVARDAALAATSALVALVHWFGVGTVALVAAGGLAGGDGTWRARMRGVLPTLAAPLATLAASSLVAGQRASLSVATWVPPVRADIAVRVLLTLAASWPLVAGLVVLGAALVVRGCRGGAPREERARWLRLAPLVALLAWPLVLLAFSLIVQPALVPRYALPAVLATAPVVAAAAWLGGRAAALLLLAVSAGSALHATSVLAVEARAGDAGLGRVVAALRGLPGDAGPIVVERLNDLLPLSHAAPDLADRLAFPDFEGRLPGVSPLERDLVRTWNRRFGAPALAPAERLWQDDRLVVLAGDDDGTRVARAHGARWVRRVGRNLFTLRRAPPGPEPERAGDDDGP